jgi:hypothetical protein
MVTPKLSVIYALASLRKRIFQLVIFQLVIFQLRMQVAPKAEQ